MDGLEVLQNMFKFSWFFGYGNYSEKMLYVFIILAETVVYVE